MTAKRRLKLVEVVWVDIVGHGSAWAPFEDVEKMGTTECRTVGYLHSRDKTTLRMFGTLCPELGSISDVVAIPEGAVRKVRVLGCHAISQWQSCEGTPMRSPVRSARGRR